MGWICCIGTSRGRQPGLRPSTASAFAFRLGVCDSPLRGKSDGSRTPWERGRPARTRLGAARPYLLISHQGGGHRLGKCLSLASCSAFLGNLQGTDCAGRAWACLGSNTRDDCCRRLRGSGDGAALFHGLTPTAKCGRRIRGLLEPRAGARGLFYESCPPAVS